MFIAMPVAKAGLSTLRGAALGGISQTGPEATWVETTLDSVFGPIPRLAADLAKQAITGKAAGEDSVPAGEVGTASDWPVAWGPSGESTPATPSGRAGPRASTPSAGGESYPDEAASMGESASPLPWLVAGAVALGALIYLAVGIDRKDKR